MIPSVKEWYTAYKGDDFEIVAVHYPEFSYEEKFENVVNAVNDLGIEYPVAIDNNGRTWRAYGQRYWPTRYVIDKEGNIRYKHIGERGYEETAAVIEALMAQPDPES